MKSLAYDFILNMWIMNRIDENFIDIQVRMNRLSQDEADKIGRASCRERV